MAKIISYSATALLGTNKCGNLTPDSDGYYTVVLGAFETNNGDGAMYTFLEETRRIFDSSSSLMRQIAAGNLWGEDGHPKRRPGETVKEFLARCMFVYEDSRAFHIRKVTLDDRSIKDDKGRQVIAVIGEIKPMGAKGHILKEILDTKSANCCFSVRAMTNDTRKSNGDWEYSIYQIVTWDTVVDPGVAVSTKYNSPKLESFHKQAVDLSVLFQMRDEARSSGVNGKYKTESATLIKRLDEIIGDNQNDLYGGHSSVPKSRNW